jgi:hypothetical protein
VDGVEEAYFGGFAAEPTESLTLKGKTAPVPAFRLIDVHPTAPAFARRLDSPLVGRTALWVDTRMTRLPA